MHLKLVVYVTKRCLLNAVFLEPYKSQCNTRYILFWRDDLMKLHVGRINFPFRRSLAALIQWP